MSPIPLYESVESALAASIADGTMPPETQLPPEEGLIERFKVSRTTVRKAIQNLIERGLVEVRRGKGTFVTQPKISQELTELTGFVEDMQALGRQATARLLEQQIVPAGEDVARHLALTVGTLVVRIRRVRLADSVPLSFDVSYLFFLFAVIVFLSAQQMMARRGDPVRGSTSTVSGRWAALLRLDSSYPDSELGKITAYRVQRVPVGMMLMYGAGLISALLGIGSGVLKIPAMDTALRLPIKVSSATSN